MNQNLKKLIYASLCLALCIVLPFLTVNNPMLGNMLCLMHIPVLLCGFLCGWPLGLIVGAIAPILRSLLFGMPPMYPTAVAMAFELAAYGFVAGLLYRLLPKKPWSVYVALIVAMLLGRVVWGIAQYLLLGMQGKPFTLSAFLAGAFVNAWPGILLQIALIPLIIFALEKAGLVLNSKTPRVTE